MFNIYTTAKITFFKEIPYLWTKIFTISIYDSLFRTYNLYE